MDNAEFNLWAEDFKHKFPDTGVWMAKLLVTQMALWRMALENVSAADAFEVSRLMFLGEQGFEPISNYDREKIPTYVRHGCYSLESRRKAAADQTKSEEEIANQRDRDALIAHRNRSQFLPGSSSSFMDLIAKFITENPEATAEEAGKAVFPPARESEYDEPRYRCWTCKDTRWVEVWSNVALQIAVTCLRRKTPLPDFFPQRFASRMVVCCTCDRAMKIKGEKNRYAADTYAEYLDGDLRELATWIKKRVAHENKHRQQPLPF